MLLCYYKRTTLVVLLLCLFMVEQSHAQKRRGRKSAARSPFLNTQWWIGVKAGGNLTKANPVARYSEYVSTQDPGGNYYDKNYGSFNIFNGQAGLEITYFHKGFSISFQPNYRRMSFSYSNYYIWSDPSNPSNSLEMTDNSTIKLDYFEFPLLIKYEPFQTRLRPFVQAGIYYAALNNAYKSTRIDERDMASGGNNEYTRESFAMSANDLFISTNIGWILGAGVSYPLGNVRLALDISYRNNTNNITNKANRYNSDRLTGTGDVLDDVKLRNLSFSLSCLIPLRFLAKSNFMAE